MLILDVYPAWLRPTFGRALLANNRTTQKGTNITDVTVNNIQASLIQPKALLYTYMYIYTHSKRR